MTIYIDEFLNTQYTGYQDELVKRHTIERDTLNGCFSAMYAMSRYYRNDHDRRFEFVDKVWEPVYADWKARVNILTQM